MRWKKKREVLAALQKAGFSRQEIDRLCRLQRAYKNSEQDQAPMELAHLQFIRWLVRKGKLTEHLP